MHSRVLLASFSHLHRILHTLGVLEQIGEKPCVWNKETRKRMNKGKFWHRTRQYQLGDWRVRGQIRPKLASLNQHGWRVQWTQSEQNAAWLASPEGRIWADLGRDSPVTLTKLASWLVRAKTSRATRRYFRKLGETTSFYFDLLHFTFFC